MGIGVQVDIPAASSSDALLPGFPEAWIQGGACTRSSTDRFLVSIFLHDCRGILARVLGVFDEGITLAAGATEHRVRFSIDGSLSSSIGSAFVLAFVIRPSYDPQLGRLAPFMNLRTPEVLKAALRKALSSVQDERSGLKAQVQAFPFDALDEHLFSGRRFSEYRFAISTQRPVMRGDASSPLGILAAKFAQSLGSYDVPIAYLYFPDMSRTDVSDLSWLRVGVGASAEVLDSLDVDVIANGLAREYSCIYRKYDPSRVSATLEDRFRLIEDYRGDRKLTPAEESTEGAGSVDVVFAEGPARIGYIGSLLAGTMDMDLLGGSMTVLAGHTISAWIVPYGAGPSLVNHAISVDPESVLSGQSRIFSQPLVSGWGLSPDPGKSFWLAWRCADRPGVFREVVTLLSEFLEVDCEIGPEPMDIRYAISRVLTDGNSCAGKLRFLLAPGVSSSSFEARVSTLERRVRDSLLVSPRVWKPRDPAWLQSPVVIREGEPGEEPWASLLVDA